MENDAIEELTKQIESGYSLSALSPVAVKLVEIASDDNCSLNDLMSLIEQDSALAVNLLKMANSAFFKSGPPVASLQQAIMRIGFHQLRVMDLSLSLRNTFPMGKVGPLDYENFWRISLHRGLIAKSLAHHLKSCNPEEAFVAGLILEIGFLILYDLFLKGRKDEIIPGMAGLEELLQREEGIAENLKLELNQERDLLELIEKANQSLGRISEKITTYQDALSQYALPAFGS